MRGLERCLASGKTIEELKKEFEAQEVPYADFENKFGLIVKMKISKEESLKEPSRCSMVDFLKRLLNCSHLELKNLSASNSVGYRECIAHLKGEIPKKELASAINYSTRRLVSKQRNGFVNILAMRHD